MKITATTAGLRRRAGAVPPAGAAQQAASTAEEALLLERQAAAASAATRCRRKPSTARASRSTPSSGMRSGEVARTLTPEEQAAAALAARQAASDADAEAARKRRDLAMAESYATEADLRRAYDERITLVEESLKTSRAGRGQPAPEPAQPAAAGRPNWSCRPSR